MRTGLFGGTFDPIHRGHLAAIEAARRQLGLDEVLVVPAGSPRLKARRPEASGSHRLEMAKLAAGAWPGVAVSDIEIRRPGPTYTVDTLEALAPGRDLVLLLGADALRQIGLWRRPDRVLQLSQPAVLARPGQPDPALGALGGRRGGHGCGGGRPPAGHQQHRSEAPRPRRPVGGPPGTRPGGATHRRPRTLY